MYVITNRAVVKAKGLKSFGKTINTNGPNELRLVKVDKSGSSWKVTALNDKLPLATVKNLKNKFKLDIDVNADWYASLKVACQLCEQAAKEKKSILFFVHGYNNDIGDVLRAAYEIEALHNVIVVPFSWPANGGGAVSGTASYLSDKADARASAGALNRVIGKIRDYHLMLTQGQKQCLYEEAIKKHPNNHQAASSLLARLLQEHCPVKISLLCHSMGNYVFKHTFATSQNVTSELVFDNICLVAADTNNADHKSWVGQLDTRKRIYVVINENDAALKVSRIKPGDEQKARLGHYTKQLDSPNAHYIDVTNVHCVGAGHTYFKGEAMRKNKELKALFSLMFKGESIEQLVTYKSDNNTYRLE